MKLIDQVRLWLRQRLCRHAPGYWSPRVCRKCRKVRSEGERWKA